MLGMLISIPFTLNTIINIHNIMLTKDVKKAYWTYTASKHYDIDPLLLTVLINSESSYKSKVTHNHPNVTGIAGINSKFWDIPNNTIKEQIYAGAYVLKEYLKRHDGDILKALHGYKGKSNKGLRQAKYVLAEYEKVK